MSIFREAYENLMEAYQSFKNELRHKDKHEFERWKAGGYIVDEDILSMYPNATKVFESLEGDGEEEDEEDLDEDEQGD